MRDDRHTPDVPALADTLPGFNLTTWNGILGQTNLPKPIVDKSVTELKAVLSDTETLQKFATLEFDVIPTKPPEEFATYASAQLDYWAHIAKISLVQPE